MTACESEEKNSTPDVRQMLGDWQAQSLRITMNTVGNKDSTAYFEVTEAEWPVKMNMLPPLYVYNRDGSFHSYDRNVEGKMSRGGAGRWRILGDSIILQDTFPKTGDPYRYRIEFADKQVRMWGREDCDGDGKPDDDYFSVMSRLK